MKISFKILSSKDKKKIAEKMHHEIIEIATNNEINVIKELYIERIIDNSLDKVIIIPKVAFIYETITGRFTPFYEKCLQQIDTIENKAIDFKMITLER